MRAEYNIAEVSEGPVIIQPHITDASSLPGPFPEGVPLPQLTGDRHRRSIDWGDGKPPELFGYEVDQQSFHHDYNLAGELRPGDAPRVVEKTITVTAADDDELSATVSGTAKVRVRLVPPKLGDLDIRRKGQSGLEPIAEGQVVSLTGEIDHPGTATWSSVTVEWGDGETSTATVTKHATGRVSYAAEHTYKDNGPKQGSGFKPFAVKVTAAADGYPNNKLMKTGTAAVRNDRPGGLTADLRSAGAAGADGVKRTVELAQGSFTDLGVLDTHTVEIDWGDGSVSTTIQLPAGVLSFATDPATGQPITHPYATDGKYQIVVKVLDKDARNANDGATLKFAFTVASKDVLRKFYEASTVIKNQGILDSVFSFAGYVYDWTVGKATAFVDGVTEFAGELRALEAQLGKLFGQKLPQVLDAVLERPFDFVSNFLDAAGETLTQFQKNLVAEAQGIILKYLSDKGGFNITAADVPTEDQWANAANDPAPVAGFVLKVLGLTWDDLLAKVTSAVGPDALAAAMQVYDAVKDSVADGRDGQAGIFKAFDPANQDGAIAKLLNRLGDGAVTAQVAEAVKDALNAKGIQDKAIDAAVEAAVRQLPALIAVKIAEFITPAGSGFAALKALFKATGWVVQNIDKVKEAVTVANALADQAVVLSQPRAQFTPQVRDGVVQALTKAIRTLGPILLDFATTLAGVDKVATKAADAVKGLHKAIDAKIALALGKVAGVGQKLLEKLIPGGWIAADYKGLVGLPIPYSVNGESHRLWARYDPLTKRVELIVASNPAIVRTTIARWKKEWAGVQAVLDEVAAVETALPPATNDAKALDPADKRLRQLAGKAPNSLSKADKAAVRKALQDYADGVDKLQATIGTQANPGTLVEKIKVVQAKDDYEVVQTKPVPNGEAVRIKGPGGYDAYWYQPNKPAFKVGHVRYAAYLDGTNKVGDPVQAKVTQFAAAWDALVWNAPGKVSQNQEKRIKIELVKANVLYAKYGMGTVTYQAFLSSGGSLSHLPAVATPEDKSAHGEAIETANGQRASAKGTYVHDQAEAEYRRPGSGFTYAEPGIDLHSISHDIWFEIQKNGAWKKHSGPTFLRQVWRAIQYT